MNFFPLKTGHKPSDEYFKHAPIWHDSDMLTTFFFGMFVGAFMCGLILMMV
jgi:hypothetical protein